MRVDLFDYDLPAELIAQGARPRGTSRLLVLDRATGKPVVSTPFIETLNWSKGVDANGQPIPDPKKFPATDGVLVSPSSNGATNWQSPSFSPRAACFNPEPADAASI